MILGHPSWDFWLRPSASLRHLGNLGPNLDAVAAAQPSAKGSVQHFYISLTSFRACILFFFLLHSFLKKKNTSCCKTSFLFHVEGCSTFVPSSPPPPAFHSSNFEHRCDPLTSKRRSRMLSSALLPSSWQPLMSLEYTWGLMSE